MVCLCRSRASKANKVLSMTPSSGGFSSGVVFSGGATSTGGGAPPLVSLGTGGGGNALAPTGSVDDGDVKEESEEDDAVDLAVDVEVDEVVDKAVDEAVEMAVQDEKQVAMTEGLLQYCLNFLACAGGLCTQHILGFALYTKRALVV